MTDLYYGHCDTKWTAININMRLWGLSPTSVLLTTRDVRLDSNYIQTFRLQAWQLEGSQTVKWMISFVRYEW